jgi:hypothetical protein
MLCKILLLRNFPPSLQLYFPFNKQWNVKEVNLSNFFNTLWRILGNGKWKNELEVLFSSDEFSCKPVYHLLKFMQDNQLQVAFKEIYKLAKLIMTIPSSTATVEQSFSAMKRNTNAGKATQPKFTRHWKDIYDVLTKFPRQNRRLELVYK